VEQAVLSLKRAAWSFKALPGDAVVSGQHQTTNILNRLHAGLELRLPVTSFTCRFRPLPIAAGHGNVGGIADEDMSFEPAQWSFYLGGAQCAQYWPHPLHPWFICHSLASWDGDSEVLGS